MLTVTDVNEPPIFVSSHYIASVEETAGAGEQVLSGILAVDGDSVSSSLKFVKNKFYLCSYLF